jgi:putative transcriptional regulator
MRKYAIPDYITKDDIKRVRKLLNMTQKEFAELIGSSKPTIERWESGKENITGNIVLLLNMIENNPDYINKIKIPEKKYPLRLFYMYKHNICTLIDVDQIKQEIKIINYTNNLMFRAFGINENPSFEDYQEFLKSRCFPETRDKLKLVLNDLDLPFYDPFLIIQKTEGKMAEDDFWIKIEV